MSTTSASSDVEYEYWTEDADGRGYCSVYSLEDALRGHFHDMQVRVDPLGPIIDVKVIKRKTKTVTTVEEVKFSFTDSSFASD